MSSARFTENETGIEVSVETVFSWCDEHARESIVSYPAPDAGVPPRKYYVTQEQLARHFTIVTPQEIFITGYGGHHDRPTKKQRELDEALVEKAG